MPTQNIEIIAAEDYAAAGGSRYDESAQFFWIQRGTSPARGGVFRFVIPEELSSADIISVELSLGLNGRSGGSYSATYGAVEAGGAENSVMTYVQPYSIPASTFVFPPTRNSLPLSPSDIDALKAGGFVGVQMTTTTGRFSPTTREHSDPTAHPRLLVTVAVPAAAPMQVESGPASGLVLNGLTGPTIALGNVVEPPVEVLAGMANSLNLAALAGPTIHKGPVVTPTKTLLSGLRRTVWLYELGATLVLAEPVPVGVTGGWSFEAMMPDKSMVARNPTASLEVRNTRKRVRTELKTLVRA